VAGGVQAKRLTHQEGTLRVEHDFGQVFALHAIAKIDIADRRSGRPPAHLGLLGHALSDLGGEVGRVELSHKGVDALHELPGGGLLDVLGNRDELTSVLSERRPDGYVVLDVPGQTVDLVDDHGTDVAFGDPRQHGPEHGAVGASRRLPGVGELPGDVPALLAHVVEAGFPLGAGME
jgi:hypothetical protein